MGSASCGLVLADSPPLHTRLEAPSLLRRAACCSAPTLQCCGCSTGAWGPSCSPGSLRGAAVDANLAAFGYPGVTVDDKHTFWSDVWGSSFVGLDISSARFDPPVYTVKPGELAAQ